jgi:hypothetical protein
MNDRNEWKTEECRECTNREQLGTTRIKMATVTDVVKKAVFTNFRAAWVLLDRVSQVKFTLGQTMLARRRGGGAQDAGG